ncbi:MAG TPA: hypothetical protein VN642_01790 [Dongiaceae bacterium]|nr:hypothetical protein [Dongiaceae bacterium]
MIDIFKLKMRWIILLLIFIVAVSLIALPVLAYNKSNLECSNNVEAFFSKPTMATFSTLSSSSRDCWYIVQSNLNLNKLITLTSKGNKWAAEYMVAHLQNLDGGNLEDSLIGLGQFGEHCIECLLELEKFNKLYKAQLNDALTMLPLALSDKPNAQLKLLKLRRSKVVHVRREDLIEQKAFAIKAIDDFISEISSKNQ